MRRRYVAACALLLVAVPSEATATPQVATGAFHGADTIVMGGCSLLDQAGRHTNQGFSFLISGTGGGPVPSGKPHLEAFVHSYQHRTTQPHSADLPLEAVSLAGPGAGWARFVLPLLGDVEMTFDPPGGSKDGPLLASRSYSITYGDDAHSYQVHAALLNNRVPNVFNASVGSLTCNGRLHVHADAAAGAWSWTFTPADD